MKKPDNEKLETDQKAQPIPGISLGVQLGVGMSVFTLLGYWVDQKTGGGQQWVLLGMLCGVSYCMYEIWKIIKRSSSEN